MPLVVASAISVVCVGSALASAPEHPPLSGQYAFWSFSLGALSAVSLLLGAILGVLWKPKPIVTAGFIAFGAGALLAALTVELVAPTAMAVIGSGAGGPEGETHGGNPVVALVALLIGSALGGILFEILNSALNSKGGYLRKTSTTIAYLRQQRRETYEDFIERLGRIPLFRTLTPAHAGQLPSLVRSEDFEDGETIFSSGEHSDSLYFIAMGNVEVRRDDDPEDAPPILFGEDDLLGEHTMIAGTPRTATAIARTPVKTLQLLHGDFDDLCDEAPELAAARAVVASAPADDAYLVPITELPTDSEEAEEWSENVTEGLSQLFVVDAEKAQHAAAGHGGAPLAIWLGIFLDGIPESFIIGATFLGLLLGKAESGQDINFAGVVPFTFLGGLFLSNFPEAMSSSIGMRNQGWPMWRILMLWGSLVVITGIGAVFGYSLGSEVQHTTIVFVEGLAAGAMLTMIAQTMIPEAVHLGKANLVGLSTLAGFLSAVAFKILER